MHQQQDDPQPGSPHSDDGRRDSDAMAALRELYTDGFTIRDEANAIVVLAFRHGPIENLHSGEDSPLLEDPTLRRITGPEMKELMLYACRKMEELLRLRASDAGAYARQIRWFNEAYCKHWER